MIALVLDPYTGLCLFEKFNDYSSMPALRWAIYAKEGSVSRIKAEARADYLDLKPLLRPSLGLLTESLYSRKRVKQ